jgi:hypothetical protein
MLCGTCRITLLLAWSRAPSSKPKFRKPLPPTYLFITTLIGRTACIDQCSSANSFAHGLRMTSRCYLPVNVQEAPLPVLVRFHAQLVLSSKKTIQEARALRHPVRGSGCANGGRKGSCEGVPTQRHEECHVSCRADLPISQRPRHPHVIFVQAAGRRPIGTCCCPCRATASLAVVLGRQTGFREERGMGLRERSCFAANFMSYTTSSAPPTLSKNHNGRGPAHPAASRPHQARKS